MCTRTPHIAFGVQNKKGEDNKKSNTKEQVRVCYVSYCRLCKSFVVETMILFLIRFVRRYLFHIFNICISVMDPMFCSSVK